MTATVTFSPIIPTLAGVALTYTPCGATGDIVPISNTGMTLVLIQNSDTGNHTVTFTSQPDQWGASGACVNQAVTAVKVGTDPNGVVCGVWLKGRWGNPATLVTTNTGAVEETCLLTYDSATTLSICVLHVPWASM